jgi:hypothetical protein
MGNSTDAVDSLFVRPKRPFCGHPDALDGAGRQDRLNEELIPDLGVF